MATETQIEVVMPQMGVSVSEGTITKWLKQEGEPIARDEALLEISTDKVDTEVPSPGEGVVAKILVQEGETVEVGTVLAVIAPEGAEVAPSAPAPAAETQAPPEPATQAAADASEAAATETAEPTAPTPSVSEAQSPASGNGRTFVSPVVARIASEHGVDPSAVQGTGAGGRVTKKDILAFVEGGGQAAPAPTTAPPAAAPPPAPAPPTAPTPPPAAAAPPAAPPAPAPQAEPAAGESFEPMTAMRKGIAEHMRRSLDTSAHVTSAIEVDMSKVVAIRGKLKPEFQKGYGVNPTYLIFVARAVVDTLKDYPWINGEIRGDKI